MHLITRIRGENVKAHQRFTKLFHKKRVYLYVAQDTVDDNHFRRCKIKNRKGKMIFFFLSLCPEQTLPPDWSVPQGHMSDQRNT